MLFDQIAAMPTDGMPPPYRGEMIALKAAVAGAEKFVLDPMMARAADGLTRDETQKALPWARPPYPRTWLEVAHADRPKFNAKPIQDGLIRPKRVGVLFEPATEIWPEHLAYMSLVWDCPNGSDGVHVLHDMVKRHHGGISVCCVGAVVDFSGGKLGIDWRTKLLGRDVMVDDVPALPFAFTHEAGYSAASMEAIAEFDPRLVEGLIHAARGDWAGEPWFWTSVLALLNAKGGATAVAGEDRSRLSRKRVAAGRPALSDFHVLKLSVGNGKSSAPGQAAGGHPGMRAHMVRGHFKHRKSGLYWWSPFVRGDLAKGFAAKRYDVGAKR